MSYKLAYYKEARLDISEAKEWYYNQLKVLKNGLPMILEVQLNG